MHEVLGLILELSAVVRSCEEHKAALRYVRTLKMYAKCKKMCVN